MVSVSYIKASGLYSITTKSPRSVLGEGAREGYRACLLEMLLWLQGENVWGGSHEEGKKGYNLDGPPGMLNEEQNCRTFRHMGVAVLCCHGDVKLAKAPPFLVHAWES